MTSPNNLARRIRELELIAGGDFAGAVSGKQNTSDKTNNIALYAANTTKYPNTKAVADYFAAKVQEPFIQTLIDYTLISVPAEGMVAYNFTTHAQVVYNGTTWV